MDAGFGELKRELDGSGTMCVNCLPKRLDEFNCSLQRLLGINEPESGTEGQNCDIRSQIETKLAQLDKILDEWDREKIQKMEKQCLEARDTFATFQGEVDQQTNVDEELRESVRKTEERARNLEFLLEDLKEKRQHVRKQFAWFRTRVCNTLEMMKKAPAKY